MSWPESRCDHALINFRFDGEDVWCTKCVELPPAGTYVDVWTLECNACGELGRESTDRGDLQNNPLCPRCGSTITYLDGPWVIRLEHWERILEATPDPSPPSRGRPRGKR